MQLVAAGYVLRRYANEKDLLVMLYFGVDRLRLRRLAVKYA